MRSILLFMVLVATIRNVSAQGQDPYRPDFSTPGKIPGMKLAWNDEFNVEGKPDPGKWTYEHGFVRNRELQYYQSDNANCTHGVLLIQGRREAVPNAEYRQEDSTDWRHNRPMAQYTSSCVKTKGIQQWQFGRFEIRARIDSSMGAWPAIWTLGVDGRWPLNGEVDIMEFYRPGRVPTILANMAWGKSTNGSAFWNTKKVPLSHFTDRDPDWVKKFHTWSMDWTADSINLYLDGEWMNGTALAQTLDPDKSNPFLQPHYLLLNLAIGASGGNPSSTPFPINYEIDYVRYYQRDRAK